MRSRLSPFLTLLALVAFTAGCTAAGGSTSSSPEVGAAQLAIAQGNFDSAVTSLDAALAANPQDVDALVLLADVRRQQAEAAADPALKLEALQAALDAVRRAQEVAPEDEEVRNAALNLWATSVNAGNDLIRDPDADNVVAAELFEIGTMASPDSVQGYYGMGLARLRGADAANAVDPLRRAAELSPNDPGPAIYYGRALLFSDQAADAVTVLEAASAQFPDDEDIETTLLNAYARSGQTDRAIERYEQSIQALPTDPVVRYNYGALLLQAERFDDAIEQLERATELDGTNVDAFYNLGAAYQNKAAALNEQANTTEDDAESARLTGERDENLEAALPYLQRAREISAGTDNEADACSALFRVYTQLGRISEAEVVSECAGISMN
ncbi:tetratricopeptide repeat protein [Rubrivirga sp. S365]|uniref:Tetratricopeptide repeat protein n=1 Tax=Rubrivirga litoralis TaxID=3075598 RepID=A0ABU3BUY2_9BACT|nr:MULTISPECIES: tetratricopeptide repeat protein [unclassified Rubrivirga]MDT0633099.1 tetratricopeptide repeat protein [Rubrivirga sp. F394]MDT7857859.1 tetratricopeptide repeat protein [Rubrivirga sp. S365]